MAKVQKKSATLDATPLATLGSTLFWALLQAAAWCLPMVPAIRINLDSVSQGAAWTVFAVGSVVFGAVLVENAVASRSFPKSVLFGVLAVFFLALNVFNALGNAAAHSDTARDTRNAQKLRVSQVSQQVSQVSQARKIQAEIAGEATVASIEAEIAAMKAKEAKRWNATNGCELSKVTAGPSRELCAELAKLEGKKASAAKRDELDDRLVKLQSQDVSAPESLDPFADAVAEGLSALGIKVQDKASITVARNWGKALGVELMAGFGPAALLMLLGRIRSPNAPSSSAKVKEAPAAKPALVAPASPSNTKSDDPEIEAFIAKRLEFVQGEFTGATPLFRAWCDHCAEAGIEPGSQMGFGIRVKKRIAHERNSGRPRYVGVRLRAEKASAGLRLAVNNA